MNKLITALVLIGAVTSLTACGGSGSSSSSGGGDVAQYAGTYKGTMLMEVEGFGRTASESQAITAIIANDGRVDMVNDNFVADVQCSDAPPIYLNGNSFDRNVSLTCTSPQLGTCSVTGSESGSVNNSVLSGSGNGTYNCTVGTFTAKFSFTANKVNVAAQSFNALSVSSNNGNAFSNAIGAISNGQ